MNKPILKKVFACIGGLLTWAAVALQLYLIITNRQVSLSETLVLFFSFFTILTNILVAVSFTAALSNLSTFFTKTKTLIAIAVYIAIVGITYNVILRGIWNPQGLQRIVDEALHVAVPIVFILYWSLFVPKEKLSWRNSITWLWYPGIYLIWVLIRGHFSGAYPYPFLDAGVLGYGKALINSGVVCVAIIVVSLLFIGISRSAAAKNKSLDGTAK